MIPISSKQTYENKEIPSPNPKKPSETTKSTLTQRVLMALMAGLAVSYFAKDFANSNIQWLENFPSTVSINPDPKPLIDACPFDELLHNPSLNETATYIENLKQNQQSANIEYFFEMHTRLEDFQAVNQSAMEGLFGKERSNLEDSRNRYNLFMTTNKKFALAELKKTSAPLDIAKASSQIRHEMRLYTRSVIHPMALQF